MNFLHCHHHPQETKMKFLKDLKKVENIQNIYLNLQKSPFRSSSSSLLSEIELKTFFFYFSNKLHVSFNIHFIQYLSKIIWNNLQCFVLFFILIFRSNNSSKTFFMLQIVNFLIFPSFYINNSNNIFIFTKKKDIKHSLN